MCVDMYRKLEGGMLTEKVEEIAERLRDDVDFDCDLAKEECPICIEAGQKIAAALREMAAWVYQDAAKNRGK